MSYKLRIILEYFQPKIGRRIRIFSLGRKNNIIIKKKKSVCGKMTSIVPDIERKKVRLPRSPRDEVTVVQLLVI